MDDKELLQQAVLPEKNCLTYVGKMDVRRESKLVITNPTDHVMAFKLKGTSPGLIRMRPGYGYVKPKENVSITVTAMPFKQRKNAPKRERVVLLISVAPEGRPENPVDFWRAKQQPPREVRREAYAIKFVEEGKPVQPSPSSKKVQPDDETEEKSAADDSSNTTEEST